MRFVPVVNQEFMLNLTKYDLQILRGVERWQDNFNQSGHVQGNPKTKHF